MRRALSGLLAIAMLAAFAVGAFGLRIAPMPIQSGSWQQAELRWQGLPRWEVLELQGHVLVEHTQQGHWQILTLQAETGQPAHVRVTVGHENIELWLFCDDELQATLAEAQAILQHPGRHHTSYILQLQMAVTQAENFYATAQITPEEFTRTLEQLQQLVANPQSVIVNNGFLARFAPTWWNLIDHVTAPLRRMSRVEIILPMLGRVISAVFSRNSA